MLGAGGNSSRGHQLAGARARRAMMIDPWTRSNREHLIVTRLTARQQQAWQLMLLGFDPDEIAKALHTTRSSVLSMLRRCCQKRIEAERLGHD